MKYLTKPNFVDLPFGPEPSVGRVTTVPPSRIVLPAYAVKQRGVVLFLTLLALLAMSLAAVALIRSVDTAAMIAGNLSFKQAATVAGSTEIEAGMTWLAANDGGLDVKTNPASILNTSPPGTGYYSFIDNRDLTDDTQFDWKTQASPATIDDNRNSMRFVIQRVCRLVDTPIDTNECLFASGAEPGGTSYATKGTDETSERPPKKDGVVQYRITVRTEGPKNTRSYAQAFVY